VERLSASDLEGILGFLELAHGMTGNEPFPTESLEALSRLVPCDEVTFTELDRVRRGLLGVVFYRTNDAPDGAGLETFWRLADQHPLCSRTVGGQFGAVKISDFLTAREFRRLEIYHDWFVSWNTEHELEVGIPSPLWHTKTFSFARSKDWPDFDERDRRVLSALQPHLIQLYRNAKLRQRLADRRDDAGAAVLTPREREVVALVREGKTNAEIARELWIAPGTVRKHLENVYGKLGVGSRTAALARLRGR
jgi:DNA-binding CsgD family transcriptional regulator